MNSSPFVETMEDRKVTYTLEFDDKFYIVENVPARVCVETGEQFFAPNTVERMHELILGNERPERTIQTPVFKFATKRSATTRLSSKARRSSAGRVRRPAAARARKL